MRARLALALLLAVRGGSAQASPAAEVAAHTWVAVSAPHVEVLTDAGRPVAERVALRLEHLRAALAGAAPALVAEAAPVQVIVFRDASLFEAYAPRWRGLRDEVAGFFQPGPDRRRLLFVATREGLPAVAQHEYTHALLDAAMPDLPLWLNEGLAEYLSTFRVEGDAAILGEPVAAHVQWLQQHDRLPMRELFRIGHGSSDYHEGDRRGTFYAQAWALTHLLLSGSADDLARLERCLVSVRDGEPFARAFTRAFGDDLALGVRLDAWLDRPQQVVRRVQLPRAFGDVALRSRAHVPPAEVLASLGNGLLARDPAPRELAEEHLRRALERAPGSPEACAGLGWLAQMRTQPDEAQRWYERALAAEPVSVPAVRLAATEWLLDVSRRSDNAEREHAAVVIRRAIGRAQQESRDPELEALLARTWVVASGDDAEPGYTHARAAAEALPGRSDVRLDLLALAALTGRDAEADAIEARWFASDVSDEVARSVRHARFAGALRRAGRQIEARDAAGAEQTLREARSRVAGDSQLTSEADDYLAKLRSAGEQQREVSRENAAIAEYNRGVSLLRERRHAEAAEAFRSAAAKSERAAFQRDARALAARMDVRVRGEHAQALARAGRRAEAVAEFESLQRGTLHPEERRWVEQSLAALRRGR